MYHVPLDFAADRPQEGRKGLISSVGRSVEPPPPPQTLFDVFGTYDVGGNMRLTLTSPFALSLSLSLSTARLPKFN